MGALVDENSDDRVRQRIQYAAAGPGVVISVREDDVRQGIQLLSSPPEPEKLSASALHLQTWQGSLMQEWLTELWATEAVA